MLDRYPHLISILLFAGLCAGCGRIESGPKIPSPLIATGTGQGLPTSTIPPTIIVQPSPVTGLTDYAFPESIYPESKYLFYLHGKIIEDQGIPAVSPDYGEYEYGAILEKFSDYGFIVVSEQRPKDADSAMYARRTADQVRDLLAAGVLPENITIVGASKGAGITILTSYFLKNQAVNFVVMGICDPATVEDLKRNNIFLVGNVLSIYDSQDQLAGSCAGLFSFSRGKGLDRYDEIVLEVGAGHGILYKPLDEWVLPAVQWERRR